MEPWCSDCTGSNRRCSKPSSSTSRSPPIDLPCTSWKIGTHPTIRGSDPPSADGASSVVGKRRWSGSLHRGTWSSVTVSSMPPTPGAIALDEVLRMVEALPPIVFVGEARRLEEKLAEAAVRRAFLLQGGDCVENFKEFNTNNIRDTFHRSRGRWGGGGRMVGLRQRMGWGAGGEWGFYALGFHWYGWWRGYIPGEWVGPKNNIK
jgi:hypothetical protein